MEMYLSHVKRNHSGLTPYPSPENLDEIKNEYYERRLRKKMKETLFAFGQGRNVTFGSRNRRSLLQPGTNNKSNIKQAGTKEEQTFERIQTLLDFGRFS
jgi:hypothetical protein